ncbi:amidohydrolase family protein, partial [Lysinibacillus sp. GbtcB16]|uniref:amidohydrolase family protein n=1 Tax=Lysinibacillus sp. GbtcB16 TaxID=2824761 RepID=UPI001C2F542A
LEEVLTATTINAAYAVNRGEQIGSLEVDKKADVINLDVANYKQLQYFYGMNHTNTDIKNGQVVVQNGILLKEQ